MHLVKLDKDVFVRHFLPAPEPHSDAQLIDHSLSYTARVPMLADMYSNNILIHSKQNQLNDVQRKADTDTVVTALRAFISHQDEVYMSLKSY